MKRKLKTDKQFLSLSIPLLQEQEMELEKSLMQDGCMESIVVWNDVIIDGHKRYRICEEECIEYKVEEKNFNSTAEAISWVCRKRISQQKKKDNAYRYLVGRLYMAQKQIYHEEQKLPESNRTVKIDSVGGRVSYAVGKELSRGRTAVESYGALAINMDEISKKRGRYLRQFFQEMLALRSKK